MHKQRLIPSVMLALTLVLQGGCDPDVGVCDPEMGGQLAYDSSGVPGLTGQVLLNDSCASGFCHDSDIADDLLVSRAGAPRGLDFNLAPIVGTPTTDQALENMRTAEILARRDHVIQMRGAIWGAVASGVMPPWDWDDPPATDPVGNPLFAGYDSAQMMGYRVVVDEAAAEFAPLPTLATDEGEEILRNWLACGAPIVERTEERIDPGRPDEPRNYVVPVCEQDCVGVTWPAIVEGILRPRCATSGCHDASGAGRLPMTGSPAQIHGRLLDEPADGTQCRAGATEEPMPLQGMMRLTAGDPSESLLIQKLERPAREVCGGQMPASGNLLSEQRLCVLREWVLCGACPEDDGGACRDCLADPDLLARCNLPEFREGEPYVGACAETPTCTARVDIPSL